MTRNKPIILIHAIHKKFSLKIFCSLFLCLFFGIALPVHHHNDGIDHGDCAFCVLQKQASVVEMAISLPAITESIIELSQSPIQNYNPCIISAFQSRAPPVATFS
jgi:hypothetical protein